MRLRLTLLYGGLFLVSGAGLLALTYVLMRHTTGPVMIQRTLIGDRVRSGDDVPPPRTLPRPFREPARQAREQADHQRQEDLQQLLGLSGIALGGMTVISIGLGWLMAGRVLRPLRTMTTTTRRISEHNLHERLALDGPSDELKDLGDTIDGLLARLEAAFDAQRRFVANASHELRTPLAMMRTSLDVASGKPGPVAPQVVALDGKLREGLDRADALLEGFLVLARAQHGVLPERPSAVALAELVTEAIEARRDAIAARAIELRPPELDGVAAAGSPTLLAHLVGNLLDNAIRHNEPAGWIGVALTRADATVRLVVENGGPQLDPERVRELAQPFRRLGAERVGSEDGVGLGLSIVAAIASAHDGELALEARPEGGLRATVELPA